VDVFRGRSRDDITMRAGHGISGKVVKIDRDRAKTYSSRARRKDNKGAR